MKRKRYSEEKIIAILKEHEAGASVPDISRRYGIAENTIYRWKSKFGVMEVSEARRLQELEAENARSGYWAKLNWIKLPSRSCWRENGNARSSTSGGRPSQKTSIQ